MIKMIDTAAYKALWSEAKQWIQTNVREIAESDLESEALASKFVLVAAEAYYSNEEDYSPNREDFLGLRELSLSPQLETLLSRIKRADRHGYATAAIREYEQAQLKAS